MADLPAVWAEAVPVRLDLSANLLDLAGDPGYRRTADDIRTALTELKRLQGEVVMLLDALELITSTAMCVKRKNTAKFMEYLAERIAAAEVIWDARQPEGTPDAKE